MKKVTYCTLITIIILFISVIAYADVNMDYYIDDVKPLNGEEYSRLMKASVYGFEEKDNISLRMGTLQEPDAALNKEISEYVTPNDETVFVEITAFDVDQNIKIETQDKIEMQITLSRSNATGLSGFMGNNYRILRINENNCTELQIINSSIEDVTFNTDELGVFAVIYNRYAFSLSFMDGEAEYSRIDNLSTLSEITFPQLPQQDGFKFDGWYQRENGEGLRLYPGITLSEVGNIVVYANWIEDNTDYNISSAKLENVTFNNEINCDLKNNQYIYFLPELKAITDINVSVKPENPYAYVYFGYSFDNVGEISQYPADRNEVSYDIINDSSTNENRIIIKIISEDTKNETIYSFILAEESQITEIEHINDAEHSWTLQADISGAGSCVLGDTLNSIELKIGEIKEPDSELQDIIRDFVSDKDTVKFFDLFAYDEDSKINDDLTVNIKVNLYRLLSSQMGSQYRIYRIENGHAVQQNILSSSLDEVIFEADKTGRFALIYENESFYIQFINDGDEYEKVENLKIGDIVNMPKQPVKNGYRFVGWFSNEDGTGIQFNEDTTVSGNAVYYACWQKISSGGSSEGIIRYTVTFEANNGDKTTKQIVNKNTMLTKPTDPIREGYTFVGWFTDKELTKEYDFNDNITRNITLYAKWEPVEAPEPTEEPITTDNRIILTVGEKEASVFGEVKLNDVAPVVKNDRTMLPARFIAESLGADVMWDQADQQVTITKGDTVIVITIGSDTAYINEMPYTLDSPAFVENDRTYTPLRFISEQLGASVEWDEDTQEVIITQLQ